MFTVYSRPGCSACASTIKVLERQGKEYVVRDAADHIDQFRAQGLTQLPVVVDDKGDTFTGFRYDRLTA